MGSLPCASRLSLSTSLPHRVTSLHGGTLRQKHAGESRDNGRDNTFSALTGLLSSALIVTAFLSGWPSIIAIILNYLKRAEVRDTWLDSHFSWQIRTFWFAFLWLLAGGVLFITLIGIPVAIAIWIVTGIWVLYRIVRGWLALGARKAMPL